MSEYDETSTVEIGPLRRDECAQVAALHEDFFGLGRGDGHSIAMLGRRFLENAFYRLNFDNPVFFVDVARYRGEVIGFAVYCSNHRAVFQHGFRRHPVRLAYEILHSAIRHPIRTFQKLAGNLAFIFESLPSETKEIRAWFLLLGVKAEYRSRKFQESSGVWIARSLEDHLQGVLRDQGCDIYWCAIGLENGASNGFFERIGAEAFTEASVQGVPSRFYRVPLTPGS